MNQHVNNVKYISWTMEVRSPITYLVIFPNLTAKLAIDFLSILCESANFSK
jgi:hypothetical protein